MNDNDGVTQREGWKRGYRRELRAPACWSEPGTSREMRMYSRARSVGIPSTVVVRFYGNLLLGR